LKEAREDLAYIVKSNLLATADRANKRQDGEKEITHRICIAFTWSGLKSMALDEKTLHNVPLSLREGMADGTRATRLGDDKVDWKWTDKKTEDENGTDRQVHVLVMLFWKISESASNYSQLNAQDRDGLNEVWDRMKDGFQGLSCVRTLPDAVVPDDFKGHFGFRDGISQPFVEGSGTSKQPRNRFAEAHVVKPGNFILGHSNEFGQQVPALWVDESVTSATKHLSRDGLPHRHRDFGRNGSYLVFRQLRQYPEKFTAFLEQSAANTSYDGPDGQELIAAKLVGRWKSGAPLTLAPGRDDPTQSTTNDFFYSRTDKHGYKCPIGSHVRRTYPRDTSVELGAPVGRDEVLSSNRRRRIIRRGRPYQYDVDGDNVGLHFICLNADIREQFEFIQESWVNNRRFGGTRGEVDPIVGSRDPSRSGGERFTIQRSPISEELTLADFVEVVGGGYFFLPSVRALKFLAQVN